jgi:hypothetical protein
MNKEEFQEILGRIWCRDMSADEAFVELENLVESANKWDEVQEIFKSPLKSVEEALDYLNNNP